MTQLPRYRQMVLQQAQPFLLCVRKDRTFSKTTTTIYRKTMEGGTKRNYLCSTRFLVSSIAVVVIIIKMTRHTRLISSKQWVIRPSAKDLRLERKVNQEAIILSIPNLVLGPWTRSQTIALQDINLLALLQLMLILWMSYQGQLEITNKLSRPRVEMLYKRKKWQIILTFKAIMG